MQAKNMTLSMIEAFGNGRNAEKRRRLNVLLVDDDRDMTETLGDVLREKSYHVEIANSGNEAIQRVKNRPFDAILLDIRMPGINGVETYKEIKKIRPESLVMFMTAQSVEDLVAEVLEDGAYGIMYKPVKIEEALKFIEESRRGVLIMFVDIDMSEYTKLITYLEKKRYRVAKATGGEEAIRLVQERDFDVVFIQAKMPVMNGLETFEFIRQIRPTIKVVMTTNYRTGMEDLIDQALRDNTYACIYKPFDVKKILYMLEEVVSGKLAEQIREHPRARVGRRLIPAQP
jgi:two-component system response regulator HydG